MVFTPFHAKITSAAAKFQPETLTYVTFPSTSVSLCGTNTKDASVDRAGANQRNKAVAAIAPSNCATINPGESAGRIPAKVLVTDRASVTAGFANEVDAVNQ
jgi:hypothetical protein